MEVANFGVLPTFVLAALLVVPFFYLWGWPHLKAGLAASFDAFWIAMPLFLAGLVAHELIHGLSWALLARKPISCIRYGIQWKSLTPYAHVREPLPVSVYRWGTFAPALFLGLIPTFISYFNGSAPLLIFGLSMTIVAGGDFLILWLIRGAHPQALAEDHPTRAGCYLHEPASEIS